MPRPNIVQQRMLPVPLGMNVADSAALVPVGDATSLVNVLQGPRGLQPRPGSQEFATNVGSGEVRSLLAYHGSQLSKDRLFACTSTNLYDVTAGGSSPTSKFAFGSSGAESGIGNAQAMVNAAGRFFLYCDETNGYYLYTEATDTWAGGSVTGVSATELVQVIVWKSRVWFTRRNSSEAWYLAPDAISGAATKFDFGRGFKNGGYLVGLYNWTRDGGSGVDDYLVAVSSSGDVVVWNGTDPSDANTFFQLGSWNVGGLPYGRKVAISSGGDLLLLTTQGVLPLSKLVSGQPIEQDVYETAKIRPLFIEAMANQSTYKGWEMQLHPQTGALIVNTPGLPGQVQEQYAMSLTRKGWSRLMGWSIFSTAVLRGQFYFGTRAGGRVMKTTGYMDDITLAGSAASAKSVSCVVLDRFDAYGAPRKKILQYVRPAFITHGIDPAWAAFARFEFDVRDPASAPSAPTATAAALWDSAVWDTAVWADLYGSLVRAAGIEGIGVYVAAGVQFTAIDYCVLAGLDVGWEVGGIL